MHIPPLESFLNPVSLSNATIPLSDKAEHVGIINKTNMNYLETYFKGALKKTLRLPIDTPDPFVYLISGSLPISAHIHLRQLSLMLQLNQLGPTHTSFIHASLTLYSKPIPNWSWWHHASVMCEKYSLPSPLEILYSKATKNQLKVLFKKKVSSFWFAHFRSLCPSYSSLRHFDTTKLIPNK